MIRWLIGEEGVKVVLVWHSSVLGAKEMYVWIGMRKHIQFIIKISLRSLKFVCFLFMICA